MPTVTWRDSHKALVLGHGPSIRHLDKVDLNDYNFIVTCHDDCGIWKRDRGEAFRRFSIMEADRHLAAINRARALHLKNLEFANRDAVLLKYCPESEHLPRLDLGELDADPDEPSPNLVKMYHMCHHDWGNMADSAFMREVPIVKSCRIYTGLGAVNFCLMRGFRQIDSLGLDFTPDSYCSEGTLDRVELAFEEMHTCHQFLYTKLQEKHEWPVGPPLPSKMALEEQREREAIAEAQERLAFPELAAKKEANKKRHDEAEAHVHEKQEELDGAKKQLFEAWEEMLKAMG